MKNEPISDTGITMTGMSVVRQLRRKKKIITRTSEKAMKIVFLTSLIDDLIYSVLSNPISTMTSSGRSFLIYSSLL